MGVFTLTATLIGQPRGSGVWQIKKVSGGILAPDGRPVFLLYTNLASLRMSPRDPRSTLSYCTPMKYKG